MIRAPHRLHHRLHLPYPDSIGRMQLTEFKKLTKLAQRQELLRINTEFKARVKTSGTKFLNEQEYEEALKRSPELAVCSYNPSRHLRSSIKELVLGPVLIVL
jgi:hypothetical protein